MERDLLARLIARLSDISVIVFSRSGEVLSQTRLAIALLGDPVARGHCPAPVDAMRVDVIDSDCPSRYWHPELGALELYRQVLVDPVEYQTLLVFTAVAGSASAEKLRLLAAGD